MRRFATFGLAVLVCALTQVSNVRADAIPYPFIGIENPVIYSFTATATGDVIAYFAGSGAAYHNELAMLVNGVLSPNGFGLENHSSAIGDSFNLGSANAGDTLTFVLHNITPGLGDLYSDPTLNAPYDSFYFPTSSHNHIYSTLYTTTGPVFPGVPAGTYVAFEDLPASNPAGSDWNYNDEDFVFTNISSVTTDTSVVPLPSTAACGGLLLAGLLTRRIVRRHATVA
jgi:hypothetical protein